MTATYSGNPLSSKRDEVRLLIGDTDVDPASDALMTDEEIDYLIVKYNNAYKVGAEAAETIAAKFAKKADKTIGPLSISYRDQFDRYTILAQSLRQRAGRSAGGAGIPKTTQKSTKPHITLGMHDNTTGEVAPVVSGGS